MFFRAKEGKQGLRCLILRRCFGDVELMFDASDYAVGAVLGQTKEKQLHVIYYASKTLDDAQANYTTTEKELLAVVYAFDKFKPYLVGS